MAPRAKGDPAKVALALRRRTKTAVTVKWIAARLQMGAAGCVNHLLYRRRKVEGERDTKIKTPFLDVFRIRVADSGAGSHSY